MFMTSCVLYIIPLIKKSRVINNDSHIHYSIFYVTLTIQRLLPIPNTYIQYDEINSIC